MKISNIILLCLIILLTLGAVSASDDIDNNSTDNITDETVTEDVAEDISEEPANETTTTNTSQKEITADDFYVYAPSGLADEEDDWYSPQIIISDFPQNGTLKVFVNNKEKYSKKIIAQKDAAVTFRIDDIKGKLGMKTSGKDYAFSIKYVMANKTITLKDYRFYRYSEDGIYVCGVVGRDDNGLLANVVDPSQKYVVGTVKVTINGKQIYSKKIKSSKKIKYLDITSSDIPKSYKYGKYSVKVTYNSNKGETYSSSRKVEFVKTIPEIEYPYTISAGENQYIILKASKKSTGTLKLYKSIEKRFDDENPIYKKESEITRADIVNGYGKIPLNNLTKGEYKFIVEYEVSGYNGSESFSLSVLNNHKNFSANVTPSQIEYGETFKLKTKSPKLNMPAYIYVDNKYYSTLSLKTGKATKEIYGVKVGNHTVRIEYDYGNKYFFSKTFDVNVKKSNISLKLDKVKVKKSASKLKLTATLKIKDKVAKNKKVTFKFNKKTFIVKTNKKGIATATITKKLLKNLKAGKKITYYVSYGKITMIKTVKVLK